MLGKTDVGLPASGGVDRPAGSMSKDYYRYHSPPLSLARTHVAKGSSYLELPFMRIFWPLLGGTCGLFEG